MRRVAALVVAGAFLIAGACTSTPSQGPGTGPASPSPPISIPTGQLPPRVQCMVDDGFRITAVGPPQFKGVSTSYSFETDLPRDEAVAIMMECRKLAPETPEKTDAELRVIYDRWVGEYECLIELGYRPVEPPSFEKFVADWKTGPWDPLFGVDTNAWSDADYAEAKERCTLEFFHRD